MSPVSFSVSDFTWLVLFNPSVVVMGVDRCWVEGVVWVLYGLCWGTGCCLCRYIQIPFLLFRGYISKVVGRTCVACF